MPPAALEKSRSRTVFKFSTTVLGVAHSGSCGAVSAGDPIARSTKCLVSDAEKSLAVAAAKAGHR